MTTNQTSSSIRIINTAILYLLLFLRIFVASLAIWIWHPISPNYTEMPAWYGYTFTFVTYLFSLVVIWLNQYNLQILNIDKPFILIFILSGFLVSIYYLPPILGIITGLLSFLTARLLISNKFDFGQPNLNLWKTIPVFIIGISPFVLLYILIYPVISDKAYNFSTALFFSDLPSVVIEEIIFRGLLWAYLQNQNYTDTKIVYVQAFLFWLAHLAQYWNRPVMILFWTVWTSLCWEF